MSVKNRTGDPCFRRPFRENELERNLRGTKGGSRGIRQMTATETSTGLLKYLWNELNECVHVFEINRCLKWCYKSATCYIVSLFTMQCVSLKTLLSNYLIQKDNVKEQASLLLTCIQLQNVLGCSDLTLA